MRLPGSGGAAEIAIHARRTVVISRLNRRAFPEAVDFVTSPGHRIARTHAARELGMPGAGPVKVVTDKAMLEADPDTGELVLDRALSRRRGGRGARPASAGRSAGAPRSARSTPPTAEELHLLRDVLDPHRLYLKG